MRIAHFLAVLMVPALALAQPAKDGGKGAGKGGPPAMPVKTAAAKIAPAVDEASAVGTLRADEAVVIRPEIAGRIAEIRFKEGQRVARGALLATLDAGEAKAQLASATAQAKLDAQRLERAEDLHKKNFISPQGLDEARSNAARSSATVREIEARLAKTELRAPFAGVIGLRSVSAGAFVAAGTDIARLEKMDQLKMDFRLPEAFTARVRTGQKVKAAVDAYADQDFGGVIYAIEPGIDEGTRTILVRARVANPDLKLRPGMFARVVLQLGARDKAVWIPEQAIVPKGRVNFVFRVADGKADMVKVLLGVRKPGEVEITSGIAGGDVVVTDGTLRLFPGAAVMLMQAKPPAPAPAPAAEKKG
ncbi:MAG: efflux RND transporter periplasmic adaptor subunit [Betaproteobacteria bacterium]|nr:efflux RND transporter periplasmic adaptor subunit [Betaproteobacteria bacterium]